MLPDDLLGRLDTIPLPDVLWGVEEEVLDGLFEVGPEEPGGLVEGRRPIPPGAGGFFIPDDIVVRPRVGIGSKLEQGHVVEQATSGLPKFEEASEQGVTQPQDEVLC